MITRATVSRRKNEWGEYVVRAYGADGARYPAGDYFTDDRGDADQTALAMVAGAAPLTSQAGAARQ